MWKRVLDRAGIREPEARRGYTELRRQVRRFAPAEYTAARLLLPAPLQPDVVVLVAFMHETDDRIDRGALPEREEALRRWRALTDGALASGTSPHPVLRALAWTVARHPVLRGRVRAFLDGAVQEVAWERFGTEAEVERYVEGYSLPALMLSMGLLAPGDGAEADAFERACLALITAMQRLDFLEDLAQDVGEGRIGVSDEALARHGLTVRDLRPDTARADGVAALVAGQTAVAAAFLEEARPVVGLAAGAHRPFLRAVLGVQELRAAAVRKAGASLVSRPCGPPPAGCAAVLLRELVRRGAGRDRRGGA
ncbi:squalene/phytoene synthase family protein [Streptomyces sp. SID5770]|uniref:phytoene/squalene synthase family protein n=1 Tax=unclassified Streptomyces TaxID=2593676 RepID=UPI001371834A|nr:squalene/phytoene synthase family protein [Streptomyces sp. SID5770]MZE55331.1 squalene/phytoene synthase family protein [Streptomyces sp. SID5770]